MKTVRKYSKTVLVQNEETGFMFHVPVDIYEEGDESVFEEHMIPYSLSFDLMVKEIVDNIAIQETLYKQGIHTLEDVLNNRRAVNNVLNRALSADALIKKVKS